MIRLAFFAGIAALALVLLIIDRWPDVAGRPEPDPDAWIDGLERVLCDGGEGQDNQLTG